MKNRKAARNTAVQQYSYYKLFFLLAKTRYKYDGSIYIARACAIDSYYDPRSAKQERQTRSYTRQARRPRRKRRCHRPTGVAFAVSLCRDRFTCAFQGYAVQTSAALEAPEARHALCDRQQRSPGMWHASWHARRPTSEAS